MSNESNFLSHHERKRLEYLYSNFHYLNEREQLEYNYLLKKSQGAYEEAEALQPEVDATEEVQGEIAEPIGDLPVSNPVAKSLRRKQLLRRAIYLETTGKDPRQTKDPQSDSLFLCSLSRWHGLHVCERPQHVDRSDAKTSQ